MEHELSTHKAADLVSVIEHHDIGDILKPFIKEIHLFDSYIAGTTHLKDQSVLEEIREEKTCLSLKDLAVNGHDLMALGFSGTAIGITLNKLLEQVLDEQLPNEKTALLNAVKEM